MIKTITVYLVSFLVLCFLSYYIHSNSFVDFSKTSPIPLDALYLFHTLFTFLLTLVLSIVLFSKKLEGQLGFLYLASMVLKIILFCIVFKADIFTTQSFTNSQSLNLLIPMALALFFEILFLSKLLNKWSTTKND